MLPPPPVPTFPRTPSSFSSTEQALHLFSPGKAALRFQDKTGHQRLDTPSHLPISAGLLSPPACLCSVSPYLRGQLPLWLSPLHFPPQSRCWTADTLLPLGSNSMEQSGYSGHVRVGVEADFRPPHEHTRAFFALKTPFPPQGPLYRDPRVQPPHPPQA